jgi:hypothetical protein
MMCIIRKERIAQVERLQGEIFAVSPIALQILSKQVPNESIPTYGCSWPQPQGVHRKLETDTARTNVETVIGG